MIESMQRKLEESKIEEKRDAMHIRTLQLANKNIELVINQ